MTFEKGLTAFLKADSGVTAVCAGRVYPVILPEGVAYPAVCYQIISETDVESLTGPSGLVYPRVQISCWGNTFSDVVALGDAVLACLAGFSGTWTFTGGSVEVGAVHHIDMRDDYEISAKVYRRDLDFEIWHA